MNTILAQNRARLSSRRETGLSLVELMVSITIGLILLMGLTTLIVHQNTARDELEKSSREIENGRYAMALLHDDIQLAGFYGEYSPPPSATYTTPDPCTITGDLGWGSAPTVPVAVFGYKKSDASPSCVSNRLANTAILVVRRTSTDTVAAAAAVSGTTYLQVASCKDATAPYFAISSVASAFTLTTKACGASLAPLSKYIQRIYYVSSCSECSGTPDTIPTLKMVEFIDGAQTTVPLVEGIENLQFDYGMDNVGVRDGAADAYNDDPATAEWQDVVTVRVSLLARNIEPTVGYTDNRTYDMGGAGTFTPATADRVYKRHAYSELIRIENISGRREMP